MTIGDFFGALGEVFDALTAYPESSPEEGTSMTLTAESQYDSILQEYDRLGSFPLGPNASHILRHDPRKLGIMLARYKFVAKMLSGKERVLEIGCGDGLGAHIVAQEVGRVDAFDFNRKWASEAEQTETHAMRGNVRFYAVDAFDLPLLWPRVEAIYALDVIEHINPLREGSFMESLAGQLPRDDGILILGTPNATAAEHASPQSKAGHVNWKTADALRELMGVYSRNVFMFGMSDEVVHTGFGPMSHYLLAMGVGVR